VIHKQFLVLELILQYVLVDTMHLLVNVLNVLMELQLVMELQQVLYVIMVIMLIH